MEHKRRSCKKRIDEIQTLLTVHAEEGTQWVCVKTADKLVQPNVGHATKQNPEEVEET